MKRPLCVAETSIARDTCRVLLNYGADPETQTEDDVDIHFKFIKMAATDTENGQKFYQWYSDLTKDVNVILKTKLLHKEDRYYRLRSLELASYKGTFTLFTAIMNTVDVYRNT